MIRRANLGQRYAFVVVGVTFLSLLVAAGLRSAPGVLMVPWQTAFGWERSTISLAAAIGIFLYGLMGPFAAAIMQTFGVRRTLSVALVLMSASTGLSLFMTEPWHLVATWGVLSGLASGCVAIVLGATIVNRWFVTNRGLVMGLLTASTATGGLVFLPLFARISEAAGWRPVVMIIALASALLAPLVFFVMRERPSDVGSEPYGAPVGEPPPPQASFGNPLRRALDTLLMASRKPDFWLLFGTFFICGFTTNGLVGTHMISMCVDQGMALAAAGTLMAAMGVFDLVGTTASGWLTDRFDPRKLLCIYYALRGISLIFLPFSDFSLYSLSLFAVFYGLDWIATVPPTLKLTTQVFGDRDAPIVFGWIAAGHQLGAALAAFMAGVMRTELGGYLEAFVIAGVTGLVAAGLALMIARPKATAAA
jgi:sugar phosphate permease